MQCHPREHRSSKVHQQIMTGRQKKTTISLKVLQTLLPTVGLFLVRAISSTYRLRLMDQEHETRVLSQYGSIVYASWHQRFFPGITFFAGRRPIAIMISQSRDGELIAKVTRRLGWHPVRGSSSRGGIEALGRLKKLAGQGYKIGHIVDGPRGPFGEIKPGLISIAQFTGIPVVPVCISAQNTWTFNSWDRFMVPKPFSRILIRFGKPVDIARKLQKKDFESTRLSLEQSLHRLYQETDRIWERPGEIRQLFHKGSSET